MYEVKSMNKRENLTYSDFYRGLGGGEQKGNQKKNRETEERLFYYLIHYGSGKRTG